MEPGLTLEAQIEENAFKSLKSHRKAPHWKKDYHHWQALSNKQKQIRVI